MKTLEEILSKIPLSGNKPHRASLAIDGSPRRQGRVAARTGTAGGVFWPDNDEILTDTIEEAVLELASGAVSVPIRNIEQCSASRAHWNFDLADC
jgi:hypothetical protein